MAEILFIKTSSLGDVIHHMPAVTEAKRRFPDSRFSWVVEEDFAPLVALHPAVAKVIPVASRRWRRAPFSPATWREVRAFAGGLRAQRYDAVIDTQGLFRSALIAKLAHGTRHGHDAASIKESAAGPFYDVRHRVDRSLHAVARNRLLTALALGYTLQGEPDYGLDRAALRGDADGDHALLLHATARPEKEWPVESWVGLGNEIASRGIAVVVPWGTQAERARSEAIAARIPGARIPERRPLDQVARLIAGARVVVGVDTGLVHLAAALAVPLVAVFTGTEPQLYGPVGQGPIAVVGNESGGASVTDVLAAVERVNNSAGWT